MGSGVAKLIRAKYPKAYEDYRKRYESVGLQLGSIIESKQADGKVVLNVISQNTYGRTGVHVSYDALTTIFRRLNNFENVRIAMPMIGAGLAGGKWSIIERIIETEPVNYHPIVYTI